MSLDRTKRMSECTEAEKDEGALLWISENYQWERKELHPIMERALRHVAALTAERDRLRAALECALNDSGCDGDLCAHAWHDIARRALSPSGEDAHAPEPNRNKNALPVTNEGGSETRVSCGEECRAARELAEARGVLIRISKGCADSHTPEQHAAAYLARTAQDNERASEIAGQMEWEQIAIEVKKDPSAIGGEKP